MNKFKKLLISLVAFGVLILPLVSYATSITYLPRIDMQASGVSFYDASSDALVYVIEQDGDIGFYGNSKMKADSPTTGLKDVLNLTSVDNAVNYFNISNSDTGNSLIFSSLGDDADISMAWNPKGAGVIYLQADLDFTDAAKTWTLIDNTATSLSVGATGRTGMMVFDTTDAAENIDIDSDVDMSISLGNVLTAYSVVTPPPGAVRNIVAGTGISSTNVGNFDFLYVQGSGAPVTITATPSIAAGANGKQICLFGFSDTNTLTLQDESNLAGSKLQNNGGVDITLGQYDQVCYRYLVALATWAQSSPYMDN